MTSLLARELLPKPQSFLLPQISRIQALAGNEDWAEIHTSVVMITPQTRTKDLLGSYFPLLLPCSVRAHAGIVICDELHTFSIEKIQLITSLLEKNHWPNEISCLLPLAMQPTYIMITNPCRCGLAESQPSLCFCPKQQKTAFKFGSAFRDRMQLYHYISLNTTSFSPLALSTETKSEIAQRIAQTQQIQHTRWGLGATWCPTSVFWQSWQPNATVKQVVTQLQTTLGLSHRSLTNLARVSRTIADLATESEVSESHLQLALQYRVRNTQ